MKRERINPAKNLTCILSLNRFGYKFSHLIELATQNPFEGIYAAIVYPGKEVMTPWDPYNKKGWNGPYVREDGNMAYLSDAWDTDYQIFAEGPETLALWSAGQDQLFLGQPGARDSDDIRVMF